MNKRNYKPFFRANIARSLLTALSFRLRNVESFTASPLARVVLDKFRSRESLHN